MERANVWDQSVSAVYPSDGWGYRLLMALNQPKYNLFQSWFQLDFRKSIAFRGLSFMFMQNHV
ncbi:hypothetical protein [Salinibacillus aidingensis]|uniref:hypothetical protein n=1 Tax=Salinibacillus aidingensis TaxID=237684 RepID=UPI0031D9BA3C